MNRLLRFCFASLSALLISGFSYGQVTADFTASSVSGCDPLIVAFTDASTGTPTSWQWDFGDSSPNSFVQNPTHTYTTAGTYTVTLTATNGSGSDVEIKTGYIIVYGKPSFNFSASPLNGCLPLNVTFNSTVSALNGPTPATYDWDWGDGTSHGSGSSPAHNYTSAGPFQVILTVTNAAGCGGTVTKSNYITPYASPVGSFTTAPSQDLCSPPDTVIFTNTSTTNTPGGLTTSWNFGDGGPLGSGTTASHIYSTGGPTFTVTMTTTDSRGCQTVVTKPAHIFIYTTPATFTMSPSPACENQAVTFTNTTPGHTGTTWDFGDGLQGTGTNATHAYSVAGTYNVTLTTGLGPCSKTLTLPIVVRPNPVTVITRSPTNPCPVGKPAATVTFTATTSIPGASFTWDFGDSQSGTGGVVTHTYSSNGYKTITVETTNPATGCKSTADMVNMPVYPLIAEITASPEADCIPLVSTFGVDLKTTLPPPGMGPLPPYPEAAVTWNWTFNDKAPIPAGTSTLATPTYTWNSKGTYTVTVTGTTANGCDFSATKTVHADEPVVTDFSVAPTTVCPKDTVRFVNLSDNVANTTYHWNIGDTSFTTLTFKAGFYYLYKVPGSYTIELITDHLGCVAKKERIDLVVVNPSNAAFNYTVDCPPSRKAYFSDASVGATSWIWDFGDGSPVSTLQNPTHTYAALGAYQVKLTTHNNVFGCTDDITKTVAIATPYLTVASDKDTFCVGEMVTFTGNFVGPTAATYAWQIGSGLYSSYLNNGNYQYTFNTRGSFDVKLVTISGFNNNCYDTLLLRNYILAAQPLALYNATPTLDCTPLNATFTDASTAVLGTSIISRSWDYGEGNPAIPTSSTTTNHIYNIPGKYTTKLFLQDNIGCRDSLIRVDYIEARKPYVDFDAPKFTICTNEALTFTNSSSGVGPLSYKWDFGDGKTDTARLATHRWNTPGIYTVTLTTYDPTPCSTSKVRSGYITVVGPTASFTMDKTVAICPPLNVNFTNNSTGATTYSWDMGTGSAPLVVENPTYSYGTPGLYRIILTATDANGCYSLDTGYAHMLGYNGAFSYTPADACAPQEIQFNTLVSGIPKITWDFGDGNVAVTTTNHAISHTYTVPGTYRPKAVFSDGANCNAVDSGTVPIRIDKVDAKFNTSVPCVGAPFTLSDASTALFSSPSSWRWLFTSSDTAVGNNPSYTFSTPGPHPVRLIVTTNWGCKDTLTKDVFINDLPKVDAGPADTGICPGDTILLTGRGAIDYTWGPDSLVSCINCPATWVRKAEPPTTYYVKGIDANGCINYDSIRARIQIQTTSQVMPGGEICIGDTFRLFAYGANYYSWEPVEFLDSAFINSPLATPIITTTYVVTAKEGTCLERKDSVTVVVHPLPIFDAGPEEWINFGSSITLQPTEKNISRIEWRQDSSLSCLDCFHPVAKPTFTTIYYATGYSDFGCMATDSVLIRVRCNGDSIYIPNTFTPNGDGQNDVFYPRGRGVTFMSNLRIYNRWGEMVFERSEQFPLNVESMGWDGTYKGKQLPPDVYVYTMSTRCPTGEPLNFKGDLTLVR
jgi:gliding motility-associated-like protein